MMRRINTMQEYPPIMTSEEVAEYLQLHPLTVRKLSFTGQLPVFKAGRLWRAKKEILDAWIERKSLENLRK